jgi:hypothetical protein
VSATFAFTRRLDELCDTFRARMKQTMLDAVPMVVQAVTSSIAQSALSGSTAEFISALKCLGTWMSDLPGKYAPSSARGDAPEATC